MFRISKLTDYGTLILVFLADRQHHLCSAAEIAAGTHVAQPTTQKLLKVLAKTGLVDSVRGAEGGYRLARDPASITTAQILDALEGPVAITECSTDDSSCELEPLCQVGSAWQKINSVIRLALSDITLADLGHPPADFLPLTLARNAGEPQSRANDPAT